MHKEPNPFETEQGAQEWINCIENERGTIREKEIDPLLARWVRQNKVGTILDLGCGQGLYATKTEGVSSYIGVDPSKYLIEYAKYKYPKENRTFLVGNAYDLPIETVSIDACFSITVWFHLKDLFRASKELARVLKKKGHFIIITPNPKAYDLWSNSYEDAVYNQEAGCLIGKSKVLLNPDDREHKYAMMSENTFFPHSLEHIQKNLNDNGLEVATITELGTLPITDGRQIFIAIEGYKK